MRRIYRHNTDAGRRFYKKRWQTYVLRQPDRHLRADAVCEKLLPIQAKYFEYKNNKEYLHEIMRKGAERAQVVASKKVKEVYEKLGLVTLD